MEGVVKFVSFPGPANLIVGTLEEFNKLYSHGTITHYNMSMQPYARAGWYCYGIMPSGKLVRVPDNAIIEVK